MKLLCRLLGHKWTGMLGAKWDPQRDRTLRTCKRCNLGQGWSAMRKQWIDIPREQNGTEGR